jgi:hypothetical protein
VSLLLAVVILIPALREVMGLAEATPRSLAAALGLLAACGLWLQGLRLGGRLFFSAQVG